MKPFRAFFTKDSPGEFSVTPSEGFLTPEKDVKGNENQFIVGYKASNYGKSLVGVLIIEVRFFCLKKKKKNTS